MFDEIHNIVIKQTGLDKVIESVVDKIGNLISVYLVGDLARGINTNDISLVLIGTDIDTEYLKRKVDQCERMVNRKVDYKIFDIGEGNQYLLDFKPEEVLLLWNQNGDKN